MAVQGMAFRDMTRGAAAIFPAALAAAPFGLIYGAEAVRVGLTVGEVLLMSAIVFAGSSQMLAVGLWDDPAPYATLALAVLLINLRHVLLGASLAGKLHLFSRPERAMAAFFMADEVWAVAEREALSRPLAPSFYFGAGVFLWCNWLFFCGFGAVLGAALQEPERYALDFAFPAIFIGLAAAFWRGWRTAPVILASAAAAVVAAKVLPGAWYVIIGAVAGILAGVLVPGDRERAG